MDRQSHDEYMNDAVAELPLSPAVYEDGLPTPPLSEDTPPASPMVDDTPSKGKGKRPAEAEIDGSKSTRGSAYITPPKTVARITAPKVVRRVRHRRANVAATVWGPCVPGSDTQQAFSCYKAILRHPNLFFQFAIRLSQDSMIDLYAIDKEFHFRFNKYSTSIIHDFARYHAPQAAYIFSWVLFPELCITDPMLRPMDGRPHLARDIPSLRWTKMVMYRDNIVKRILTILAIDGHRVPRGTHATLMKFWLLMEMNTTQIREAFLSDLTIWTDQDIYLFHLFLVKLDMHFNHPVLGHGFTDLSHMLLTQKSLSTLYKVLLGDQSMDYDHATDMLVKTYLEEDLDLDENPWLGDETENGVPAEQTGLLLREGWDLDGDRMESPVDMVSMEGIKRGLDIQRYLLDFITYGYVDPKTKQNLPAPRQWRGEKKIAVPKGSWPTEDVRTAMIAKLDKKFGIQQTEGRIITYVADIEGKPETLVRWVTNPTSADLKGTVQKDAGEAMDLGA